MVRLKKKKQNSEHNAFILRRNTKVTLQCCHDYRKFPTTIGYLKTNVWKKDLVQETLKTYVIRKSGAAITYALLFNSTSTYIHRNLNVESLPIDSIDSIRGIKSAGVNVVAYIPPRIQIHTYLCI